MNPLFHERICRLRGIALVLATFAGLMLGRSFADSSDEEFAARLLERGYFDLLEFQYKEWLSDAALKASPNPAQERVQKTKGLIALYTALAERAVDQRDRKRYHQLALSEIAQLKKQSLPPEVSLRLDLDEAQVRLDEVRALGPIPPPIVNDEGETKPSPTEQEWDKVLALYAKISKDASRALEELIRSKKPAAATQAQLEAIVLEAGLRGAWARYYYSLALPPKDERRAKSLKAAMGTFDMTATSYPDKEIKAECLLGCALCARELGQKDKALQLLDEIISGAPSKTATQAALYNKAMILYDLKQFEQAYSTADAALNVVTGTTDVERRMLALLLKAKAGYALAATKQGSVADRFRAEAEKAATQVAQAGGRWAVMAQELLATAGGTTRAEGGQYEILARADKAYEQQKWAEAARAYESFLASKPSGASKLLLGSVHMKLAFCYYGLKDFAKSAQTFKMAMEVSPDPSIGARAAYFMALATGAMAAQSSKPEDAAAYLDALALVEKRYPNHEEMANVQFRFGAALETAGKLAEAAQRYRNVPPGSADYREAQFRAGLCDAQQLRTLWKQKASSGQTKPLVESAAKSFKVALADPPEGDEKTRKIAANAALQLAGLYLSGESPQPQEALRVLEGFEKKFGDLGDVALADALFLRFWAYEKLGQLDEAYAALKEAAAKQPTSPQIAPAFEALAVDYDDAAQKAKGAEAKDLRSKAVLLLDSYLQQVGEQAGTDRYERLLMRRANAFGQLGQWEKAAADYEVLYKRYPGALNVNKALANCYAQMGQYEKALNLYRDLEEGTPPYSADWWEARYNRALMFFKMRDFASVTQLIEATRIIREDLGGPEFRQKFEELLNKAAQK